MKLRHLLRTPFLAMSLAACHADVRGGPATPAPPSVGARVTPPVEPEWIVASAGSRTTGMMRMWEVQKDGSRKVATGPFRLVVHPGSAEIAPDLFASDISDAFEFRGSWYFVTTEGDLFRAASFLGAPVDVGAAVGRGALASRVRGDSVLQSDRDGALWSFDGQTTRRLKTPGPVSAVWVSTDGTPLASICGRWYAVDAANRFSPARPHSEAKDEAAEEPRETTQVSSTRIEESLASREAVAAGALNAIDHLLVLPSGSLVPDAKALSTGGMDHCGLLQAGRQQLISCSSPKSDSSDEETRPPGVVYRLLPNGSAERWMEIPSNETPVAGPGPSLFVHDQYDDLWIHADHRDRFSERIANSGQECASPDIERESTVLGMSGPRLLVVRRCIDDESFDVVDLSSAHNDRRPTVTPLATLLPGGARILDAMLSADQSTLSVVMRGAGGEISVARGELGGPLLVHPLPPEAKAVAFVDAHRGMAIGQNLGQVWSTTDGAARWSRLPVPVVGDPAAVPLTAPPTCNLLRCSSGTSVVWADPRALQATGFRQPRLLAPGHLPGSRTFTDPPPRREKRFARPLPDGRSAGCPQPKRPMRDDSDRATGLGNFGGLGH